MPGFIGGHPFNLLAGKVRQIITSRPGAVKTYSVCNLTNSVSLTI